MTHGMESPLPTHDAIRAQVQLMVASTTFSGAQRAIRLLSWVVGETLAGRAAGIKDYTVGAEGLGRGPAFDPRTDATARVEAHRLRTRIALYYAKEGAADPVRISLPKGSYVPVFAAYAPAPAPAPIPETAPIPRSMDRRLAIAGIGAVAVAASLYAWRPWSTDSSSHYTQNEEARRLYEQGVYKLGTPDKKKIDEAIDHFLNAIRLDERFALAHVKLANCYILKSTEAGPDPLMMQAKDHVARAIEIDGKLAEAYALRGFIAWIHDVDSAAATRALDAAFKIDSNSAEAHYTKARVLADTGHFKRALEHARATTHGDLMSAYSRKRVPYVLYLAGDYEGARKAYDDLLDLEPDFIQAQREIGLVYQETGMFEEALRRLQKVEALPEHYAPTMIKADIAQLHAVSGNTREAERILAELLQQAKTAFVSPYDIAVIYAGLHRQDAAFAWLEKAVKVRPFWLSLIKVDPRLEALRADTRFGELLRTLRL
jgi:tetratricopeptide (TPR) repeat protein